MQDESISTLASRANKHIGELVHHYEAKPFLGMFVSAIAIPCNTAKTVYYLAKAILGTLGAFFSAKAAREGGRAWVQASEEIGAIFVRIANIFTFALLKYRSTFS